MQHQTSRTCYQLPQAISVLNLLSDAVYARICMECGWDDETYNFYLTHSHRIPQEDLQKINRIITSQTRRLAKKPPLIITARRS
ncbi:hypothetical protein [Chitinophaga sp.]|uniref:hypothetical protein n=1 Tax=Chitinophaga sp. TaxID=1869181 RepID=UPI0031E04D64